MFTTCLFVIVTSITTDTTSNKQSNNTGTNNLDYRLYPNTSHIHPYMYG